MPHAEEENKSQITKPSHQRLNNANLPCDGSHRRSNFGSRIAAMNLDVCSVCGVAVAKIAVCMNTASSPDEGALVRLFDASISGSAADPVG